MSIETDIRTHLLADGDVAALVGTRVYAIVLPQDPTYPAITYHRVSGQRVHNLAGPAGRGHPRITLNCWAETYVGVKELAAKVRAAMDGFRGTMGSSQVDNVMIDNEIDFHEDEIPVYRVLQDYFVSHRET